MTGLAALAAGVFASLLAASVLGVPGIRLRARKPRRSRPSLEQRLKQAGVSIGAGRYLAVVIGSTFVVGAVLWTVTGALPVAVPPAAAVLLAPRYWFARLRREQASTRAQAWPEALRDLAANLPTCQTLVQALIELGHSGPEPLRPVWLRFERNVTRFDVDTALDVAQADLADPVADRVIEALRTLQQKGTSAVAMDILEDLIETTADDVRQVESLYTAEFELRVQAAVVPVLPFVVLAALCAGNSGFREFYTTRGGAFVVCLGVAMALVGWYAIQWLGRLPAEERVFTGASALHEAAT